MVTKAMLKPVIVCDTPVTFDMIVVEFATVAARVPVCFRCG